MNQQELSAAASIGLLYLIRMLGLFMVLPVLPLFANEITGATPLLIGVAIGIYGLSQALLQIPFGLLSDRIGRKKVIAAGLVLFIAGSVIAGFSDSVYGLIVGRFLQGCGAIASTLLALMSDLTRVDQRGKSMAIIGISIASSFALALILGPFVAVNWGVAGVFQLSALLGLIGIVVLFWQLPTPTVMTNNPHASLQRGRLVSVVKDLALWRLNLSIFCLHFLLVSAFAAFPLLFLATGSISADEHSLYYLGLLLVSFILMLPLMWLSDRLGKSKFLLIGAVAISALSFWLLSAQVDFGSSYIKVMVGTVLFFMAFNLLEVLLPAQVSRMSAAGDRGTAMGVYTTCQFLGIFAGGLVSGWILQMADINTLMLVNLGITLGWLLIAISLPQLGDLGSRAVQLSERSSESMQDAAKGSLDALLSLEGVIDAVIIEKERVAYLKVDERRFDDDALARWTADDRSR